MATKKTAKKDDRLMTAEREKAYALVEPFAVALFNIVSPLQLALRDCVMFSGDKMRFRGRCKHDLCYINRRANSLLQTEIFASPYVKDFHTALAVLLGGFFLNFSEKTSRGNIATARSGKGKDAQLTELAEFLVLCGLKKTDHADGDMSWRLDVSGSGARATLMKEFNAKIDGLTFPPATPRPADPEGSQREPRTVLECSSGCGKRIKHRKEKMVTGCSVFTAQLDVWEGFPCPRCKQAGRDGVLTVKGKPAKTETTLKDAAETAERNAA